MVKNLFTYAALACAFCGGSAAVANDGPISGATEIGMDDTLTYSVPANAEVTGYRWMLPRGCKVISGQGTNEISLRSTFLAQDGALQVERTFTDEHKDTLSLALSVYRMITGLEDHSIPYGSSEMIAGEERSVADIYYEPVGTSLAGKPLYKAHRLTVIAPDAVEMTKPYLQTLTDSSVWICWKTASPSDSRVRYGIDGLTQEAEGTAEKLSDTYYWHSVQLTGLKEYTKYQYSLTTDESETVYSFMTAPSRGSRQPMRILLMGDHQIKSRSGYEWLMQAAKRKIMEKYGSLDSISMIMNIGDQVDDGVLSQYEQIHLFKSSLLSPYLPIMTAVGNHETYHDTNMALYAAHYHYENLPYQGIESGTENYYAYQIGRVLFIVLSTEHTGEAQKAWVRRVVDAAKTDDSVEFIISVNHRPIQAEQYIGDISAWVRNEIIPILSETPKHVFNYGGHHHLYHRGQLTDYPIYHIINGAASWDQLWGMSSEADYADVQKTIDYWGYQILEFDYDRREMSVECYAIGNRDIALDNILIDSYHRRFGLEAPEAPSIEPLASDTVTLPVTFAGSPYASESGEKLNTTQFQIASVEDFSILAEDVVRDVEDFYGSTGTPLRIPIDLNENVDITKLTFGQNELKNGTYYLRVRYRDENLEWSAWSDTIKFTVVGSIDGDPGISMTVKAVEPGEKFSVDFQYVPTGQNAWVGIYHKFENPGSATPSTVWSYTNTASGTLTFSLDEPDEYYAVLFKDGGYTEVSERIPFLVGSTTATYTTDKTVYEEGEPVVITYENIPALQNDWFGVYRMGEVPGGASTYSDSWLYITPGQTAGTMTLATGEGTAYTLPKGYYYLSYLTRGYYFEPYERVYFSVGSEISSVRSDTLNYKPGEDLHIYYSSGPGTPKDWVGFYEEGKTIGEDELSGFYYTYGATDGMITVPAGELAPADYFVALYINDSYDAVSNFIHVTIGKAPELSYVDLIEEDGWLHFAFNDEVAWRDSVRTVLIDGVEVPASSYVLSAGELRIDATVLDRIAAGTLAALKRDLQPGLEAHSLTVEAEGWQDATVTFNSVATGIDELQAAAQPSCTYDAATEVLSVVNPDGAYQLVQIYGTDGRMWQSAVLESGENEFSLAALPSGVCLVRLQGANAESKTYRIVR